MNKPVSKKMKDIFYIYFYPIQPAEFKEKTLDELSKAAFRAINSPHNNVLDLAVQNHNTALKYATKAVNDYGLPGYFLYINVALKGLDILANQFNEIIQVPAIKLYEIFLITEHFSKLAAEQEELNKVALLENIHEKNYWESKKNNIETLLHLAPGDIKIARDDVETFLEEEK